VSETYIFQPYNNYHDFMNIHQIVVIIKV